MNDNAFSSSRDNLNEFISQAPSIGIVIGGDQNLDKTAAALALFLSIKEIGKNAQVVSRKEPIVEISNLVGIDKIKKEFEGAVKTLVISVPYHDGDIEKVSYNIEGDRLNVNLFAETNGINFSDQDIQFVKKGSSPTLIFTIGISSQDKLTGIVDMGVGIRVVNIDNNPTNSLYGDLVFVDPNFSSMSEIVVKILSEISLPITVDVAQNLMDGLSRATSDFSSSKTSPFAFEAAALLLKNGAKRSVRVRENKNPIQQQIRNIPLQKNIQNQSQNVGQNNIQGNDNDVPSDWFVPKVFKGSQEDPNI